jgi:hypothetical protein
MLVAQGNAGNRIKDQDSTNNNPESHPYMVRRWRLDEDVSLSTCIPAPLDRSPGHYTNNECPPDGGVDQPPQLQPMRAHQIPEQGSRPLSLRPTRDVGYLLPVDHVLLHLITQNVSRGLTSNKSILRLGASFINAINNLPLPPNLLTPCEIVVVRPTHQAIPPCLQPTQLQMNLPHPSWIDVLPFPDMRDNLIRRQPYFNHAHFLEDLVGDLVHTMPPALAREGALPPKIYETGAQQDDAQLSPNSKGMILWGEPHLKESWEVTPRFLRKWAWAAAGCNELVTSSNKWRSARGEYPLEVSLKGGQQ